MLSPPVAGGTICLGCQLRAVSRRAAPGLAAAAQARAQNPIRRRRYASEATRSPEDELAAILRQQSHSEDSHLRQPARGSQKRDSVQDNDFPFPSASDEQKHTEDSRVHLAAPASAEPTERQEVDLIKALEEQKHANEYDVRQSGNQWHEKQPVQSRRDTPPEHNNWADGGARLAEEDLPSPAQMLASERPYSPQQPGADVAGLRRRVEQTRQKIQKYRKGNMLLREDRERLEFDTLGEAAEIIVLRESGDRKKPSLKDDDGPTDPGLQLSELTNDQEDGLGLDIILENLDELRPEHRILPSSEFKALFDSLMNGFTSVQLERYIERQHQRLAEGDETPFLGILPDVSEPKSWILEQSHWTPVVKGAVEDVGTQLKGYILKSMPPKQRLVIHLMRESWGMSAQELMDGQGALEVRIRDLEFRLLTLHNQRWLQLISRLHLSDDRSTSIQVIKSRKAIRIVAPKVIAESCLKVMDETLQKIKTKSFKIDKLGVQQLSSSMIEDVSKVTNAIVELNKARKEVEVTWIHIRDDKDSKLEDMGDIVFRLLFMAKSPVRSDKTLTIYPKLEGKGRLIEDIGGKDKLSWLDRRQKWARLCLPLGTKPHRVESTWPLGENVVKYKVEAVPEDFMLPTPATLKAVPRGVPLAPPAVRVEPTSSDGIQPAPTEPTPSGWFPFKVRTSAVFGHMLHPNNTTVAEFFHQQHTFNVDPSASPRTLYPVIPPLAGLDLPAWVPFPSPPAMTCLIVMRLMPHSADPQQPSDPLAPHLELRMKASDERIIEIDCLRAISHVHVSDILLPAEHVDVRVTQKLVADFPGNMISAAKGMEPLLKFLANARLEMHRGRLDTPPRLENMLLPRWMYYRPEDDIHGQFLMRHERQQLAAESGKAKKTAAPPYSEKEKMPGYRAAHPNPAYNDLRPNSYVFAGLEIHHPLETTYDGWKLRYTSVEAGQGGGRRAELSLDAVPSQDRDLRRRPDGVDTARFLRSMYGLARGLKGNVVHRKGEEISSTIEWVVGNKK